MHQRQGVQSGRWIFPAILVLATVGLLGGCGARESDEDTEAPKQHSTDFSVEPDASPFHGPTPLTIKFTAEVENAGGPLKWEWAFGDGTKSTEPEPVHTFTKPGVYQVGCAATNPKGEREGGTLLVRAYTEEELARVKAAEAQAQAAREQGQAGQAPEPNP